MNYLAFDLGASSGKAFLGCFDGERLCLENVHRFANGPVQVGQGLYWNYMGIHQNMMQAIAKAGELAAGRVDSFGVDTFSNDFGFVDKAGMLLAPVFCYRDKRTARCREAVYAKVPPEELYQITGNQIAPFNAAIQLASMREEGRDLLLEQADKLLFLPDLLLYYLTGQAACEYTIASVSQLYDWRLGGWSDSLLQRWQIPRRLLAEVQSPGTLRGRLLHHLAESCGVRAFPVVSVCQHDTASAFLAAQGQGAIISSGTWAIVGAENEGPLVTELGRRHNMANEGSLPGHHRLLCSLMGNWILQELQRAYRQAGQAFSFAEMEALAAAEPGFRWHFDVDDECFFAPGNMLAAVLGKCRALYGSAPETPGQVVRCVCESMALKCLWTLEKLEALLGRKLPSISLVGGGSRDGLTCQLLADASGRVVLAGPADASALGNIMVQMMAMGELAGVEQGRQLLRLSFPPREYLPQAAGMWPEMYGAFKQRLGLRL